MKCDNEENGCEWNGELRQLDDHMAGCESSLICCPNECLDDELKEVFVMRKDLDSHLCECPNREFECPHCQERGKYHEMTGDHLDDCPQIEVPCPKKCKTEVIRGQLQQHLDLTCPNMMKNFISYSRLQGFVCEYLKDDSLYFRVSVKVYDLNKPWLSCTSPS